MKKITSISNDAKQAMTVVLDDGSQLKITLQYIAANKGWFISFVYGSILTVNMQRIVVSRNILRKFRNVIPFGIVCVTTDVLEPIYKDDFSTGRAFLFILNSAEVLVQEKLIALTI